MRGLRRKTDVMANIDAPVLHVRHADLTRTDDSMFRSNCPVCRLGILMVRRSDRFRLMALDCCIRCGQQVIYDDIAELIKFDENRP